MTEAKFTIGHMLAAGVHIETVRYYQRRGLVNLSPKRPRVVQAYFRQISSGTNDNKATLSVTPTMLWGGPNTVMPAATSPTAAAPRRNAGPDI